MMLMLPSVDDQLYMRKFLPPSFSNPSLAGVSNRMNKRLSPLNRSTSIPFHLLPSLLNSQPSQCRYESTIRKIRPPLYRFKASQGTYRRVNSPSLTPEQVKCLKTAKALGLELTTKSITPTPTPTLSHLTSSGTAHMISIASKLPTHRSATAVCTVLFSKPAAYAALSSTTLEKGDALAVARVAGITAAKKTADLIPLTHPGIGLTGVSVEVEPFEGSNVSQGTNPVERAGATLVDEKGPDLSVAGVSAAPPDGPTSDTNKWPQSKFGGVAITATVECEGKTGVEMEALTAASVAGLTVYDMCKGLDKGMVLQGTRVVKKTGGKSGGWVWDESSGEVRPIREATTAKAASTTEHAHAREVGDPSAQFQKLMAMDAKQFAAEVRHMTCWRTMLWKAKQQREKAEDERTKAHVAKREEEVRSGERGRVEQDSLEKAHQHRRERFESSADGTVLVPEVRPWMLNSG